MRLLPYLFFLSLVPGPSAAAQISGSTGIDLVLDTTDPAQDPDADGIVVIDLAEAWTFNASPGPGDPVFIAGKGTYDPERWAVIFEYASVNVAAGHEVRFLNHPSRAPVVWLVQGDADIQGTVNLNATGGLPMTGFQQEPGPGGFRGGSIYGLEGWTSSSGFGPGGGLQRQFGPEPFSGSFVSETGSHAGDLRPYNNFGIGQLIGGSGGASFRSDQTGDLDRGIGGAGGGAILIAADGKLTANRILANGAFGTTYFNGGPRGGNGAGGSIRLVAADLEILPGAEIHAGSGTLPDGRVRFEYRDSIVQSALAEPVASVSAAICPLFPSEAPSVWIHTVAGIAAPADPVANISDASLSDVQLPQSGMVNVVLRTSHVPDDWSVILRVTFVAGPAMEVTLTAPLVLTMNPLDPTEREISVVVDLSGGVGAMQAIARAPQ